jgi:mannose-6-phosphate isomerase-like protein (cupin superfamily)
MSHEAPVVVATAVTPRRGGWKVAVVSAFALGTALGVLAPRATSLAAPPPPPRPSTPYSIDNCVNTFSLEGAEKTNAGHQYWFFGKTFADGSTLKLSTVGPHQASHAPHRHVEEEFFYVVEGSAEFYLEGQRRVVGPNTGMYAPSNLEHGIRNAGDGELRYLVIKKYL